MFDVILFVVFFIWQLPQNLVALCMMPFLGKLKIIRKSRFAICYEGEKMRGGISLGSFCFLSPRLSLKETSIRHELYGHTWDSRLLGPLYMLIIGLPSILNAWFGFTKCYYSWYPEKLANKHAGLYVDDNCNLKIK